MSLWSTIAYRLKEIFKKMIGARTIEQELHVAPVISNQMEEAIELWSAMYKNQAPWLKEPTYEDPTRIVSLGLPAMIASEKARTALLEMKSEITPKMEDQEVENPDYTEPTEDVFGNIIPSAQPPVITQKVPVGDTTRAEYLESQYAKLKKQLRKQVEYGIAKGGLVIKPYVVKNDDEDTETTMDIEFDFIQADAFFPLAFDASGKITEAAFLQSKADKDTVYRRLEYHKWQGNTVKIENRCYKSLNDKTQELSTGVDLGQEVPLTEVAEWKDLQATTTIKNVHRPLFAYFKLPEANTIEPTSPLGVSGYSRAVQLIKDADMQYSRLLWEYEAGEMAIDIDRDAFLWKLDRQGDTDRGHSQLPSGQQRLFRQVDISDNETFQYYTPALRDTQYIQGLNTILMRIEDVTGLSRGTISDAAAEARTATELKILKQRSYQTNADIQQALEDVLKDVIYVMNVYCDLYQITVPGEYDTSFEWDDSIIVDIDTELNKRLTLLSNGISSKLETRMWYFGETEDQARQALTQIQAEAVENMQNDMIMESNTQRRELEENEEQ